MPPEKRVLNVEVLPSQTEYKPGQKATVKVKLTDFFGKPFVGSTVVSVYDKSVEYISGGSNVPEIKEFFWKWRRHHYPQTESSLNQLVSATCCVSNEVGMANLGVFGEHGGRGAAQGGKGEGQGQGRRRGGSHGWAAPAGGQAAAMAGAARPDATRWTALPASEQAGRAEKPSTAASQAAAPRRPPAVEADRPQELRRHRLLERRR